MEKTVRKILGIVYDPIAQVAEEKTLQKHRKQIFQNTSIKKFEKYSIPICI